MRKANFIVGFNNWGKSTILFDLFKKKKFYYYEIYNLKINDKNLTQKFIVQIQSNDDISKRYIAEIERKMNVAENKNADLFAALCPSLEPKNDVREILQNPIFAKFGELNFFVLKNKWEGNASLNIENIKEYLSTFKKVKFHIIDKDTKAPFTQKRAARLNQLKNLITTKYKSV